MRAISVLLAQASPSTRRSSHHIGSSHRASASYCQRLCFSVVSSPFAARFLAPRTTHAAASAATSYAHSVRTIARTIASHYLYYSAAIAIIHHTRPLAAAPLPMRRCIYLPAISQFSTRMLAHSPRYTAQHARLCYTHISRCFACVLRAALHSLLPLAVSPRSKYLPMPFAFVAFFCSSCSFVLLASSATCTSSSRRCIAGDRALIKQITSFGTHRTWHLISLMRPAVGCH